MSIIKDLLTEHKLYKAQSRRKEIRKYLNYYSGTSTSHYINKFEGDWYSQLFFHYVIDN